MMNDLATSYEVTRQSGSSFRLSFFFLPKEKRDAITAVYAFCRAVDDVVDEERPEAEKRELLQEWRADIARCYEGRGPQAPLARALVPAIERFHLPRRHFEAILDGCAMDVAKRRYESFPELESYCYRVAGAVGLLCIEIFGYSSPRVRDYAVALGTALQLTNILRDVASDLARDRIYLPLEDLRRYGVPEEELRRPEVSDSLKQLLAFQAERARSYYAQAAAHLPPEERRRMLPAEIMGGVYGRLLQEIAARDYDVFHGKVGVPTWRQLGVALKTCWGVLSA